MIKRSTKFKKGQLLVEVIISIGLIAMMIAAVIPLVMSGVNASSKENEKLIATLLVKEQIEAVKNIKEGDWNDLYFPAGTTNKGLANFYYPEISSSKWILVSGQENIIKNNMKFTRYLTVENVSRTGLNAAGEIEANFNSAKEDPSTQKVNSIVTLSNGQNIIISEYFTRFKNEIWTQTSWQGGAGINNWTNPPGNQYATGTDVDTAAAPGSVVLEQTGPPIVDYWGNHFLLTATTTIGNMNANNFRSSLRFRAQKNGTVNKLRINLSAVGNQASQVTYRYGLQSDNSGNPSGIYLSSATANFSTTGWQNININPVNVQAGNTYHLVVQYESGSGAGVNRYIALLASNPNNLAVPLDLSADSQQNTLWFNGTLWTAQNYQPVYLLGFNDNTFEGNPYQSNSALAIYGSNLRGEIFTLPQEKTISGLRFYISKNTSQSPADALYVTLRDMTSNTTLINNGTLIAANDPNLATSYKWFSYSSTLTLTAGHQFRVHLSSPTSASNRYYRIISITTQAADEYRTNSWGGVVNYYTTSGNSGANWNNSTNIDLSGFDLITSKPAYAPFGELISSTYDVTKRAGFNRLYWTIQDLPSNTTIKLQLAANNDNTTWNFTGPDGTTGTYYSLSGGENVWTGLANNRYLRYKIRLETTDNKVTPEIGEVKINLSP